MKTVKKVIAISLVVLVGAGLTYLIGCICSAVVLFFANFFFKANLFTFSKILIGGLICNIIGTLGTKASEFKKLKNNLMEIWET